MALLIVLWLIAVAVVFLAARHGAERSRRSAGSSLPSGRRPEREGARKLSAAALVSINAAGVEDLCRLPGIGRQAAERIVRHREQIGRFHSLEDLNEVDGFDRDRIRNLAEKATV